MPTSAFRCREHLKSLSHPCTSTAPCAPRCAARGSSRSSRSSSMTTWPRGMARPAQLRKKLLDYALGLPEAQLEHPWGADGVKVRGKIFALFGMPDGAEPGMSVKLPESSARALSQPGVTPTGYGLGNAGWVSIRLSDGMS